MAVCASQAEISASQAETQPTDGINTQSQLIPEADSWAKLVFRCQRTCVWLKNDFTKCGKLPDSDISYKEIVNEELMKGISKNHFVLERRLVRGLNVAYLKDLSTNGTYVNGELIGKENTRILGHKDDISLVKSEIKVFRFYYLSEDSVAASLPKQVKIDYHVMDLITTGQFSQIYYALNKKTLKPCVMKVANNVSLNIEKDDGFFTELKILRGANHTGIIDYYNHILIDTHLYLFVEYMDGPDLGQFLRIKGRLSELYTRMISKQIIAAIEHLNSLKIAHRSIRPKNILLNFTTNYPTAKIKNFRTCKKLRKGDASVDTIGTTIYDAPETRVRCRYDVKVDVWSFGVLLYVCLCGREPLEGRENNAGGRIQFSPKDVWSEISTFARNVIEVSLDPDPKTRYNSGQVSRLPWFIKDLIQRKRPNILTNTCNNTKRLKTNFG